MVDIVLNGAYGTTPIGTYDNGSADTVNIVVGPSFSTTGYGVIFAADDTDTFNVATTFDYVAVYTTIGPFTGTVLLLSDGGGAPVGSIFFEGAATVNVVCFTRGSMVMTPDGEKAIETLSAGDLVMTRDNGPQPIRWIGSSKQSAETLKQFPNRRPVKIKAGAFGDNAETTVSPAHRVLLSGWRAEALFGESEVLATAASLINDTTVVVSDMEEVEYFHMLFDSHELVLVDGLWSESFHPATIANSLEQATRDEVLELFPELETGESDVKVARPSLRADDVAVLMS